MVAAVLGLASAAVSAYWALGGDALLSTVGGEIERWGRSRSAAVVGALSVVVVLKLVAAVLPLICVGVCASRLPEWSRGRVVRLLAWISAVTLAAYGSVLALAGFFVEVGLIDASADADETGLAWHAYLWDPWFAVWGIGSLIALWLTRATNE